MLLLIILYPTLVNFYFGFQREASSHIYGLVHRIRACSLLNMKSRLFKEKCIGYPVTYTFKLRYSDPTLLNVTGVGNTKNITSTLVLPLESSMNFLKTGIVFCQTALKC